MTGFLIFAAVCAAAAAALFFKEYKSKNFDKYFYVLCAAGFILRIATAGIIKGYSSDISCFTAWSEAVFANGLSKFYSSVSFSDYPPGYLYVLYTVSALRRLFGIGFDSAAYIILLKLPAIICDILCGAVIFKFAVRSKKKYGFFAAAFFIFNPMVWFNSCIWGQVDSVFTLFILLALISLYEGRDIPSALWYAAALIVKPQAVIVFPVYIYYIGDLIYKNKAGGIKTALISAASGAALFFAAALPFSENLNPGWIFKLYMSTLSSYKYATLNTPNLYGLFGGNGIDISEKIFGISHAAWSYIFTVLLCIGSVFVYFGKKRRMFETAAFLVSAMYVLSAKMHERYFYPVFAFLMICFLINEDSRILIFNYIFTFIVYIASAWVLVLDITTGYPWIAAKNPCFILLSLICVTAFTAMTVYFLGGKICIKSKKKIG